MGEGGGEGAGYGGEEGLVPGMGGLGYARGS